MSIKNRLKKIEDKLRPPDDSTIQIIDCSSLDIGIENPTQEQIDGYLHKQGYIIIFKTGMSIDDL